MMKKHIKSGEHLTSRKPQFAGASSSKLKDKYEPIEHYCCFYRCNESFLTAEDLKNHCHDSHSERRALNQHISRNESENVCSLCNRHFATDQLYNSHLKSITSPRWICETCNKPITRKNISAHEKYHQNQELGLRRVFHCDLCDASYYTRNAVSTHKKKKHLNSFPELCQTCGKRFATKKELNQHEVDNHMVDRPYKCTECTMAFTTQRNLQNHWLTHTGDRPYKCSYCDNTYRHSYDRVRHEKSAHLNEKEFACSLCEAVFIRDRDRRIHMISHTGVKLFPCDECDYSSNLLKELNQHREEVHGYE